MLVYHKEYDDFLLRLREVGVVHVDVRTGNVTENEELQKLIAENARYRRIIKTLEKLSPDSSDIASSHDAVGDIIERVEQMHSNMELLKQALSAAEKDYQTMKIWGEFDMSIIDKLRNNGYELTFYQTTVKAFDEKWNEQYNAIIIKQVASRIYFVTLTPAGVVPEIDAEQVKLPDNSLSHIDIEVERLHIEIKLLQEQQASFAQQNLPVLRAAQKDLSKKIEFSQVALGGERVTEDKLVLLQGWVPEENVKDVTTLLDSGEAFYELRSVKRGEDTPVKLKNNVFTRMFEVLTKMYGMPGKTDFDPTFMIAPFFSLFFAFCMGDAGYGLVLILLGFLLKKKLNKDLAGMMNLVITLGIFTTVIGAFLGTFFGISLIDSDLPQSVKKFIFTGNVELFGSVYDKQMILALAIGIIHISIAMTVKAINSTVFYGFKESLSAWGWWLLVVGGVVIGTLSFLSVIPAEVSKWAFIAVGSVAAIGIYLLNNFRRNIFVNIGAGLWDTYNMASGLLGDVLSYIRLFALGLAGGMLGQTFNSLAMMVVDGSENSEWSVLGWIGFGLIILVGHTLNIAMSCLSAFVHPLRLTFVEYFKNAGYEGKGVEYKPFK